MVEIVRKTHLLGEYAENLLLHKGLNERSNILPLRKSNHSLAIEELFIIGSKEQLEADLSKKRTHSREICVIGGSLL